MTILLFYKLNKLDYFRSAVFWTRSAGESTTCRRFYRGSDFHFTGNDRCSRLCQAWHSMKYTQEVHPKVVFAKTFIEFLVPNYRFHQILCSRFFKKYTYIVNIYTKQDCKAFQFYRMEKMGYDDTIDRGLLNGCSS